MNLDQFFNRTYNKNTYNCAHFVSEVWAHIKGEKIDKALEGFLLPPKDRFVKTSIRRLFKRLDKPENPCIVLMQRPRTSPHVGLFYKGKVLQIHESGVEYSELKVATRGFKRFGFYTC